MCVFTNDNEPSRVLFCRFNSFSWSGLFFFVLFFNFIFIFLCC